MKDIELFREGDWRVGILGIYLGILHEGCGRREAPKYEFGGVEVTLAHLQDEPVEKCFWCKKTIPLFIQHMWLFVTWCKR